MSKKRAIILSSLLTLVLFATIYQFVRMTITAREIGSLQRQIAELREAASSTFEQTIRRFYDFDRRLGELAPPEANLASGPTRPKTKTHTRTLPTHNASYQRDERMEQEIKLKRDLLKFSKTRTRVCENRRSSRAAEERSKRCEDSTHLLAAQGNSAAQKWLGTEARDKQHDPQLAIFWLEQAANQGDCAAMDELGAIYAGSEQQNTSAPSDDLADSTKALYWYGKSASLGDVSAMGAIARIYQDGRLVSQNQHEAILWYEFASKAAFNKGGGSSNFAGVLGDIYYNGTGADQDKVEAVEWYAIACADAARWNLPGDQSCMSRSRAASELSPVEVAKAQALAVEWEKLYRQTAWGNRRRTEGSSR